MVFTTNLAIFLPGLALTDLAWLASHWFYLLDTSVAACLFPAALAILISGLDDMALNVLCLWSWVRKSHTALGKQTGYRHRPEKRVAAFFPLWRAPPPITAT